MTHHTQKQSPENASIISLDERWEVDYWTRTFGVTEQQLREAISRAGDRVSDVREYLRKKNR